MPEIPINFANKKDDIPAGVYSAVIDLALYVVPEDENKTPYVRFQFIIADGDYMGRKAWWKAYTSEAASYMLANAFAVLGYEPDESGHILIKIDDASNLLEYPAVNGRLVKIKMIEKSYDTKTWTEAGGIISAEGGAAFDDQAPLF